LPTPRKSSWGQQYATRSDPAFILPWRLDPEKGLALANESQRQLTREIAISSGGYILVMSIYRP
jgi:hypothetical protein